MQREAILSIHRKFEMNAVWEEQQELYKHFLKEMELYQEVLSDEEKAQMQKVLDAFGMES